MTPLPRAEQAVLDTRLEVPPTPWSPAYRDYWGTQVTAFEVHEPHERLDGHGDLHRRGDPDDRVPGVWPGTRCARPRSDRFCETLSAPTTGAAGRDLLAACVDARRRESAPPTDFARAVCRWSTTRCAT